MAARILDFGTRRRRVFSVTLRPLYSQGKSPGYPLDRRLGGPQSLHCILKRVVVANLAKCYCKALCMWIKLKSATKYEW
jgi:hypothetical protein